LHYFIVALPSLLLAIAKVSLVIPAVGDGEDDEVFDFLLGRQEGDNGLP
jgi:hypothetical protein